MKRISIKIVPNAKKEKIIKEGESHYKVKVRAPAIEGKANEALIEALAKYFGVSKSHVKIARGEFAKNKILEIQ